MDVRRKPCTHNVNKVMRKTINLLNFFNDIAPLKVSDLVADCITRSRDPKVFMPSGFFLKPMNYVITALLVFTISRLTPPS